MQIINIYESWKRLWSAQEIRILVLVSLCFQFGLFFLSPLRKRTGQKLITFLLWFFYLLADYTAILALGSLLKRQNEGTSGYHSGVGMGAFWAPFLLLHLGGSDTITSFSIEDNELWLRHFLGLVVQVVVAFTVLLELVVIPQLRVSASFVFIAGLIKYSEKTWALRTSSMDKLRSSMFKPKSFTNAGNSEFLTQSNDLTSNIVGGYDLFKRTMPLMADLRLTSNELHKCRDYFRSCTVWRAFKLVELELSFLYDLLHTKAIFINGLTGCLWRFVSLELIFSACILFFINEKTGYAEPDIIITYVLFGSALFMELISLLLIIFSHWMIVALEQYKHGLLKNLATIIATVMSFFFSERTPQWSNSMGQYSLLNFALRDKNTIIRRILRAVKVKNLWDKFIFIQSVPVPRELKQLLFEHLKYSLSVDLQELKDGKGEKVLQQEACNHLRWSIKDKEFDMSILLWHIATDLCFHPRGAKNENRETSSIISNYMVYLLIMKPSMMPDGIGKIRFEDTCAAVKLFYQKGRSEFTEEEARKELLNLGVVNDEFLEKRTWSVLSDARRLAKDLDMLEEDKRWRVISRVWVEMLGHAAINCKTYYHAMQLSKGGEFLTHVYLLMAQMCTTDAEAAVRSRYNYQVFVNKLLRTA